ncbi:MAG TPA: alpha/beta fold hydrolase [Bacteroidales bacterium]|nr:alpha/beta fold hydrolase [Bacteroidales bacterium]HSA42456.1 alpha/beta fold hydrolase [Bacteroidales bacterium]
MRKLLIFNVLIINCGLFAQNVDSVYERISQKITQQQHQFDQLEKKVDDVLWYHRVGDVALIDKVFIYGPPRVKQRNPTAMGVNNPLKFWAYVFIPRGIDLNGKYPLLVFPHGGVHGNFDTYYTHILRELMAQQYIVVAPEYRGSNGYGKAFYEAIDYGGREVEDAGASREYMLDNYSFTDKDRVGILGWSHGGMIALLEVFNNPDNYRVAFAGVPVSDLIARMGYHEDDYRALFSADYHLGKTAGEDVEEYKRRSPAWNAHKLKTPLLIHTNTNDDDVNVLEVEHLIKSLKAEGKKFDYEIFKDYPGGHSFDRIDTRTARELRLKIYAFLAKYLKPPKALNSLKDMEKAAYLPGMGQ